jgi:hypothetical protein
MKTKKKKPTIKEVALRVDLLEGGINQLVPRALAQAKLFNELVSFLNKENEFKEFLKERYIPEKMKDVQEQNTK